MEIALEIVKDKKLLRSMQDKVVNNVPHLEQCLSQNSADIMANEGLDVNLLDELFRSKEALNLISSVLSGKNKKRNNIQEQPRKLRDEKEIDKHLATIHRLKEIQKSIDNSKIVNLQPLQIQKREDMMEKSILKCQICELELDCCDRKYIKCVKGHSYHIHTKCEKENICAVCSSHLRKASVYIQGIYSHTESITRDDHLDQSEEKEQSIEQESDEDIEEKIKQHIYNEVTWRNEDIEEYLKMLDIYEKKLNERREHLRLKRQRKKEKEVAKCNKVLDLTFTQEELISIKKANRQKRINERREKKRREKQKSVLKPDAQEYTPLSTYFIQPTEMPCIYCNMYFSNVRYHPCQHKISCSVCMYKQIPFYCEICWYPIQYYLRE